MTNLALNIEYIFGILIFFNRGRILRFWAPLWYYEGVLTQRDDFQ